MGVKTFFNPYNSLNQAVKQKVVGPLFKKRNSTCARFTFSGSGLVPLSTPVGGGAGELARARATCGCAAQNGRPKMGLKKFKKPKMDIVPVIIIDTIYCEMWRVSATTYD